MTLVLIAKDLVLEGSRLKLEDKQVPSVYIYKHTHTIKHLHYTCKEESYLRIAAFMTWLQTPIRRHQGNIIGSHHHIFIDLTTQETSTSHHQGIQEMTPSCNIWCPLGRQLNQTRYSRYPQCASSHFPCAAPQPQEKIHNTPLPFLLATGNL